MYISYPLHSATKATVQPDYQENNNPSMSITYNQDKTQINVIRGGNRHLHLENAVQTSTRQVRRVAKTVKQVSAVNLTPKGDLMLPPCQLSTLGSIN